MHLTFITYILCADLLCRCWLHATHFDALKIMKRFDGGDDKIMRLKMLKGMASLHGGRFPNCGGVQSVLGSHDQIGDRQGGNQDGRGTHRYFVSRVGGRSNWHARAQTRAWFCFQNCMKGLPMTFMGSETLQNGMFSALMIVVDSSVADYRWIHCYLLAVN